MPTREYTLKVEVSVPAGIDDRRFKETLDEILSNDLSYLGRIESTLREAMPRGWKLEEVY